MKVGYTPENASALSQAAATRQQVRAQASLAQAQTPTAQASATQAPRMAAAGVPVTLSQVARGSAEPKSDPAVFDADKVQQVKDAIEKGSFKVNAEAIADKLLGTARDILSPSLA
jgi:negative regulator of flagellin synthesis FlgM